MKSPKIGLFGRNFNKNKRMKANELRIGNNVMYKGREYRVYSIQGAMPRSDTRFDRRELVELSDNSLFVTVPVEDVCPIPITDYLLKVMGFKDCTLAGEVPLFYRSIEDCNGCYLYVSLYGDYAKMVLSYGTGHLDAKIHYLHELQNLYYSITSKELQYERH